MDRIDPDSIAAAETVIRPYIRRTPVLELDRAQFGLPPGPLVLKLEQLQHAGSFKTRGAFANLLLRAAPAAGVAAASGGNHGAAVAYAARQLGIRAQIFVQETASPAKTARIRDYGAELVIGGESHAEALTACEAWAARTGAMTVHAFDQVETMRGAGTLGLELEAQAGVDTVMAAVGGGGLMGGLAGWFGDRLRLVAVEPQASPTLHRALAAGQPVEAEVGGLAGDSLSPRRVGQLVFPLLARHVAANPLVSDDDIQTAQAALWRVLRLVVEPGGAAAFAALLSGAYAPAPDERVAVILSGANTTAVDFGR
ncbi:threonine dehydratase [Caulobacter ginsengisoli]|uniref:Threonine dehydratase n=1 Tax=Caulobacter ginsengisoli TaxID=400775 RepID=A0ABU0IVD1_9CAUL|nr:threonine/serine dehydratase [Caulobacter ginsengisoli]MDQ0465301.1 threonine dehydratase [Caulobacter ginsengisoli]